MIYMAYNLLILKKAAVIFLFTILAALAAALPVSGQQPGPDGISHVLLIMPFENASNVPGIDWINEAFPEVLSNRLNSSPLLVISRADRMSAFDHLGIPPAAHPSRATIYEIAQQLDAAYVVMGRYNFDGNTFTATAQVMDMTQLRLSPELVETGPLTGLIGIQTALAWDILNHLSLSSDIPKGRFVAQFQPLRLDALENYVRGILSTNGPEKIRRFKEAVRLEPGNSLAVLHLGEIYYSSHEYEPAATWLAKIPSDDPAANEAHFYLGLSAYYAGQLDKADAAFRWLSTRLPLTEIYNNLGVVAARKGDKRARGYFENSVQIDPRDSDYRFNLALALYREGDAQGAARQLREILALQPDVEARALLDSLSAAASAPPHLPAERIKLNYDESSFRQLSLEIANASEARLQKLDPSSHAANHLQRGRQLMAQGLFADAEKQLREAAALDASSAQIHAALAEVLAASQDNTEARNEARVSLKLSPSAEAYVVLARVDLAENNPAAAQQNIDHALALEPGNAAANALKRDIASALASKPQSRP
jgi:tetratricopeptide (TPR) repeat protein